MGDVAGLLKMLERMQVAGASSQQEARRAAVSSVKGLRVPRHRIAMGRGMTVRVSGPQAKTVAATVRSRMGSAAQKAVTSEIRDATR